MSDTTIKYFRGSCPDSGSGRTVTVEYAINYSKPVSMVCGSESGCTYNHCPVKEAILTLGQIVDHPSHY